MKKKILSILFLFYQVFGFSQITSTFDTDADGWTFFNSATAVPVSHNSTNGNPNGFVSATYASNTVTTTQHWFAPAKFLGNQLVYLLGRNISFDLQQSVVGTHSNSNGDIEITGTNNFRIVLSLPIKPAVAPAWSSYSFKLDETQGWRLSTITGTLATRTDIIRVLTNITAIKIRGTYATNAVYISGLDNVIVEQRTSFPPPITITTISQLSGKPGSSITISGTNFGTSITDNKVFFGAVAATITNASPTSLTVTVPVGATYDKITITNKTTGVSLQSAQPFNPTFDGGGRIIPASFDHPTIINLTATGIGGLEVADVDGDGFSDIVVADNDNQGIDFYRNLGLTGDISTASFAPPITIPTGGSSTNAAGLKIIDLDGDGMLDISSSIGRTAFQGSFVTFRNISTPGNLAFEAPEYWDGKSDESPVYTVADIDGDGFPELIGGEGSGGAGQNVWIAQNISTPGNIEFGTSLFYFSATVDDAASGATLEDLDNDGKPEFILRAGFNGNFSIFKNTSVPGALSFGTPFTITESINGGIVVADFNLDGKNDLAWKQGFSNDDVHIRINTNSGSALAITDFATEIILDSDLLNYGGISIGDINGDGKPDILASDSRQIGVFENKYSGGVFDASAFIKSHVFEAGGISTYPTSIIPNDLNGDGKPDLIVGITNVSPRKVYIYQNKNVIAPAISLNTVSPLNGKIGSTVTITGNYFSSTPTENIVHFGAVQANVLTATPTQLTVSVPTGATLSLVSVTRDNLTSRYHLPFVPTFGPGVIFDNTHFAPPVNFLLTTADYDIEVADLNGDGKPDVVAEGQTNRAYSFLNTHTSGAISLSSLTANDTTSSTTSNPILVDIDEDGFPDILSANGLYRNISTNGKIDFMPLTNFSVGSNAAAADFNLDGKTDILAANGTNVSIAENRSARPESFVTGAYPTVSPNINYAKPATGGGTASADFDNDGWPDFVSTNPGSDNITVWRNNGAFRISTSQFTAQPVIAMGDNPGRIYKGDLDVDGKMDLVIYYSVTTTSQFITVLHNQSTPGNILFNRVDYPIGAFATVAHISDLDGDGRPEILVTSESSDQFFILKNTSSPGNITASSFGAPFSTAVNNPRGLSTADLNLDGRPEVIVTSAPNSLLVYENLIPIAPVITFTAEPFSRSVCEGSPLQWSVSASGTTNLTYQWQKENAGNFVNLSNDGTYSGVTTSTLTISATASLDGAVYRCFVNGDNAIGISTAAANLTVHPLTLAPQTWGFAFGYGGTGSDQVWDVATDNQGNHVVAGQFENTITIGTNTLVSAGGSDIFLAKFDRKGNVLWTKREGGSGFDRIIRIDLDAQGNIVAAGSFEGTTNLGGTNYISAGSRDVFVAKFDSNGNLSWVAPEGGNGTDDLLGVAADKDGNVFITGQFTGSFTYGSTPINSQTAESDIFTAKYSSTGAFQWIRTVMGSSFEGGWNIDTDDTGNCYVTGTVRGTVNFGLGTVATNAGFNAFIASYSSTGSIRWANTYGGSGDDVARSIATKTDGTSYVVGSFSGTVKFNTITLTASSATDAYIASFDSNGVILWVTNFPSTASEDAWSVDIDSNGNIYAAGYFNGDLSTCNTTMSTMGGSDLYVVKLKPSGSVVWMTKAGDTNTDIAYGIAVAAEDLVYVGGSFNAVSRFDNFNLTGIGNDAFIAKIGPYISITDPLDANGCIGVTVTYTVSATGDTGIQYQWQVDDGNGFTNITNNATYSGELSNTLSVLINATLDQYRYRCIASSIEAIDQPSGDAGLTVSTNITPIVSFANGLLIASQGDSYQWYHNNIPIPGETAQALEISFVESGIYNVEVTLGGCSGRSVDYIYLITSTESVRSGLKLYPNPIDNNLEVEFHPPYSVLVFSTTGRLLKQIESKISETSIDFSEITTGLYILQLKNEKGTFYQRVIKK